MIGRVNQATNKVWLRERLIRGDAFGLESKRLDFATAFTDVEVLYIPIKHLKDMNLVQHPELSIKAIQTIPASRSMRDYQVRLYFI